MNVPEGSSSKKYYCITSDEADLLHAAIKKALDAASGAFLDFGIPVPESLESAFKLSMDIQKSFGR